VVRWPIVLLAACGRIGFDPLADSVTLPSVIYATTDHTLYSIDPMTLVETRLVDLVRSDAVAVMTCDLAVDRAGTIIVADINLPVIYRVDPATGACAVIPLSVNTELYGLTFVPPGVLDPIKEVLLGAGADSNLYVVDASTGALTLIGPSGVRAHGDIVWTGSEAVMSVAGSVNDLLYRIDLASGNGTLIGDSGVAKLLGLAQVGGTVFGMSGNTGIVTIDPTTARATPVATDTLSWTGASAPDG
jgi:hypothetical protein